MPRDMWRNRRMTRLTTVCVSATLFGISLTNPSLHLLAWVAAAPLLHILFTEQISSHRAFLAWGATVILAGTQLYAMFFDALPLSWALNAPLSTQYTLVTIAWTLTIGIVALPTLSLGLIPSSAFSHKKILILFPAWWVLMESSGALLLSLLFAGSGGLIGVHMTPTFVGYVASATPLLFLAKIGGVFLLSYVVMSTNTFLAYWYGHRSHSYALGVMGAIAAAGVLTLFFISSHHEKLPPLSFSIISTRTPVFLPLSTEERAYYAEHLDAAVDTARGEFVILPEASEFLRRHRSSLHSDDVRHFVIVDSDKYSASRHSIYRNAELFDTVTKKSQQTYKQHLMPVGEYMPLSFAAVGALFGEQSAISSIAASRNFSSREGGLPLFAHGTTVGIIFCNEIWSPSLSRTLAHNGATVIFDVASHNWYQGSSIVQMQVERAAQIRAVEVSRPLLMSNDMAPALHVTSRGVLSRSASDTIAHAWEVTDAPETTITPYQLVGPLGTLAMFLVLFTYSLRPFHTPLSFVQRSRRTPAIRTAPYPKKAPAITSIE